MLIWIAVGIAALAAACAFMAWLSFRRCGVIEGLLLVDGRPAPEGMPVACEIVDHKDDSVLSNHFTLAIHNEYAETRSDGTFTFKGVRAGDVTLGRCYGTLKRTRAWLGLLPIIEEDADPQDYEQLIVVKGGASVRVVLGEGGRTVRGRMILPEAFALSENERRSVVNVLWGDTDSPKPPEGLDDAGKIAWWKSISNTPEGLAWREVTSRRYQVAPDADGNFEVRNVVPGNYRLISSWNNYAEECGADEKRLDAMSSRFLVPPVGDEDARTVEAGVLPLKMVLVVLDAEMNSAKPVTETVATHHGDASPGVQPPPGLSS